MLRKKVQFIHLATHVVPPNAVAGAPGVAVRTRIVGVDSRGRAWERFSDMPHGQWGQIEPPDEPDPVSKKRARKR